MAQLEKIQRADRNSADGSSYPARFSHPRWKRLLGNEQWTLELGFDSHLPFASGKDLQHLAKRGSCEV
jgi:hypothetical protein